MGTKVSVTENTFISAEHLKTAKYGKLRMLNPVDSSRGSHRRAEWLCDCGRIAVIEVCGVATGHTSTCGKCELLTAEHFRNTKYGSLKLKFPKDLMPRSKVKLDWMCDCGRETKIQVTSVVSGHTKKCGKCSILPIEYFQKKHGKLKMITPREFHKFSHAKVPWQCDCGNIVTKKVWLIATGHTSSCGACNIKPPEFWSSTRYGQLTMANPQFITPGSNIKVDWKCTCGGTLNSTICAVTAGHTVRCGQCRSRATEWYEKNKQTIRSLKTPFAASSIPPGWIRPVADVKGYDKPFKALCGACGAEYSPIWGNMVKGSSLTCGCVSNHISSAQYNITSWIKSLGLEAVMEHSVGKCKYDIFVPDKNLLIEYQGLRWHSMPGAKRRDFQKYQAAIDSGFDFISIFEDEWLLKREQVKHLLKSRLLSSKLTLDDYEVLIISQDEADSFYNEFHRSGGCIATIHYGVLSDGKLIAVASFKDLHHGSWELVRMVSDSDYAADNACRQILSVFIQRHNPLSITTFSNNRVSDGEIYKSLGFTLVEELPQDNYLVKSNGGPRHHKNKLTRGLRKIWNIGSKRWTLHVN